jgi:recombination protein RecR
MSPIDRLSALFEKFPGIGPRQARRFVQYLLVASPAIRSEIAEQVRQLGSATAQCKRCYRWYTKEGRASECSVCADVGRDKTLLFLVEKDADIDNVERSGYKGLYFVLGGTIPLAAEDPERHIRIPELNKRIAEGGTTEVILGLSATSEGDHTREILQEKLRENGIKLTSLGRGLSTGSELEYADPDTISAALSSRS